MQNAAEGVSQQALVAMATIAAVEDPRRKAAPPTIEDISALLFKLHQQGVDLGDVSLRRVPGGYYSEDVETLIGRYLAYGYAQERSPVRLEEKGRTLLHEIVEEEKKSNLTAVEHIAAILGVSF